MFRGLDAVPNIPAAFFSLAEARPALAAYSQALPDSPSWRTVSFAESARRISVLAHSLLANGLVRGERVAIISATRPEWLEAEMAILCAGGVCVSIYPSIPWQDVGYILYDSGASIVFAENQEQIAKLETLAESDLPIPSAEQRAATTARLAFRKIITFEEVESELATVRIGEMTDGSVDGHPDTISRVTRRDVATFVYTSGTTGPPKGVVQTHGNHLSNIRQVCGAGLFDDMRAIMLFLPLAHSYAKLLSLVGMTQGLTLKFPSVASPAHSRTDPIRLSRDIAKASACIVPTVPRLLEKIQAGISAKAAQTGIRGELMRMTLRSARACNRSKGGCAIRDRVTYALTAPVRRGLKRKIFGSRFRYAISAGAKLAADTHAFFDALGIEIVEGYGLTETCVATNVGRPGSKKIGSVGPVLAEDIEIRLAQDGEVQFRGPNIAVGYHNRPEATARAWDADGWFRTGDIGMLDADGHLRLIGRKKEIIVTAGGKKVAPDKIEERLKASTVISQAVVIGEGRPYCVALLTLSPSEVRAWAARNAVDRSDRALMLKLLCDHVGTEIARVNSGLASFETIKRFRILPIELTVENQMLTPTFKLRRAIINERFQAEVDDLYRSEGGHPMPSLAEAEPFLKAI